MSRERLERVFDAALRRVHAGAAVERALAGTEWGDEALVVLALGKAAGPMAAAAERVLGERIRAGLAVTKRGFAAGTAAGLAMPVREASHPVPDGSSVAAADAVLSLASSAGAGDRLLVLLSGGASALLTRPAAGLGLEDLAGATAALLEAGADIHALNCVRKHCSSFSGGRLAAATPAGRVDVLVISDVPGDDLATIGSGPCAPDPTTFDEALAIASRCGDRMPAAVRSWLEAGLRGRAEESPKPGDPVFERVHHRVIASNADAREAACLEAERLGLRAVPLGEWLAGEARDQGRALVARALGETAREPTCLVAGGETTVTVRGGGLGGRSQELALAAALELAASGDERIRLLAAGTDGNDGPTDAAGATCDAGSVAAAERAGVSAQDALERNASYEFFAACGGLLKTGPTGTNVMDLALVEIDPVLED